MDHLPISSKPHHLAQPICCLPWAKKRREKQTKQTRSRAVVPSTFFFFLVSLFKIIIINITAMSCGTTFMVFYFNLYLQHLVTCPLCPAQERLSSVSRGQSSRAGVCALILDEACQSGCDKLRACDRLLVFSSAANAKMGFQKLPFPLISSKQPQ